MTLAYLNLDACGVDANPVTKLELYIGASVTPAYTDFTACISRENIYVPANEPMPFSITLKAYDAAGNVGTRVITGLTFTPKYTATGTVAAKLIPDYTLNGNAAPSLASTAPSNNLLSFRLHDDFLSTSDVIAAATIDFTANRDFSGVTSGLDTLSKKSFVHNLAQVAGIVGSKYTLYVPYDPTKNAVHICPGATSLTEVNTTCAGGVDYKDGESGVSIVTINAKQYWAVPNMTGTQVLGASTTPTTTTSAGGSAALANTGSKTFATVLSGTLVTLFAGILAVVYRRHQRYDAR
jgi:hypothetical protein